jgi:hypothetical protein
MPTMPKWQAACITWIDKCQASFSDCQYFDSQCSDASGSGWAPKLNVDYYDFTKTMDQYKARKEYFINQMWTFINSRKISIGARTGPTWVWYDDTEKWQTPSTNARFLRDRCTSYLPELETALLSGINVLLYAVSTTTPTVDAVNSG